MVDAGVARKSASNAFFRGLLTPETRPPRTILFFFSLFQGLRARSQNRLVSAVAVSPSARDQWERSVRRIEIRRNTWATGSRRKRSQGRSGLGPFLHPPSRKTPTPFFVKMFAVAAQTTVRATAQVKATKVAAKEQKSAYVPPRFPASSISRRFSSPAIGGQRARRGDDDDDSRAAFARGRVAHRRVSIPRVSHAATVARVFARRLRARPRCANNEIVAYKSRGGDTHRNRPSSSSPSAVPSPPRLPAPPRPSSSWPPPRRSRTASP